MRKWFRRGAAGQRAAVPAPTIESGITWPAWSGAPFFC